MRTYKNLDDFVCPADVAKPPDVHAPVTEDPPALPDVHAPYVAKLSAEDDWAGLVRYWMAHQHAAALPAAWSAVIRVASRTRPPGQSLIGFPVHARKVDWERAIDRWTNLIFSYVIVSGLLGLACTFALSWRWPVDKHEWVMLLPPSGVMLALFLVLLHVLRHVLGRKTPSGGVRSRASVSASIAIPMISADTCLLISWPY